MAPTTSASDTIETTPPSTHAGETAMPPNPLPSSNPSTTAGRQDAAASTSAQAPTPDSPAPLARTQSSTPSSPTSRLRSASIKVLQADAPLGMWAASGTTVATAPSLGDIRRGTFHHEEGWANEAQVEYRRNRATSDGSGGKRRLSLTRSSSGKPTGESDGFVANKSIGRVDEHEEDGEQVKDATISEKERQHLEQTRSVASDKPATTPMNGYGPPPKLPWTTSTKIGLLAFWRWFLTPLGFAITIYGLNVVAWGGMLFLLLCNAAPAMCTPTCNDINSPRRIWIEIDSQILNALFCVTGFGLIPWRFRDLYWLMMYRGIFTRNQDKRVHGIRMLAGIHRGWFRLRGSDKWQIEGNPAEDEHNNSVPLPLSKRLDAPLTGIRAPPTSTWRMDFVIWCNVWNTFFQACLCGFMWGMNRYNRPSWSTGLFVAIACIVAGLGGIMMAVEGKKVKKVEGVPPKVAVKTEEAEAAVLGEDKNEIKRTKSDGYTGPMLRTLA